jgi:hypothetical protein
MSHKRFKSFLKSLKTPNNALLHESIQKGYNAIYENTYTVYHGTPEEFDEFDATKIGTQGGEGGFWFTADKRVAKQYQPEPHTMEDFDSKEYKENEKELDRLSTELKNLKDPEVDDYEDMDDYFKVSKITSNKRNAIYHAQDQIRKGIPTRTYEEGKLITATITLNDPYVYDYEGDPWDINRTKDILNHARNEDNDGVIFKNMVDDAYGDGIPSTQYVVFDKANIKIIKNSSIVKKSNTNISPI